jgi:hypothetical protein
MILADDLIAAVDSEIDVNAGRMYSRLAVALKRAERFVLTEDVAAAAYGLACSRPSSLVEAMPLCRVPYPSTWIEWPGSASSTRWTDDTLANGKIIPVRLGALIECADAQGLRGVMSLAWSMPNTSIPVFCPLSIYFDFAGNLKGLLASIMPPPVYDTWQNARGEGFKPSILKAALEASPPWRKLGDDPVQLEAMRKLSEMVEVGPNRFSDEFLSIVRKRFGTEGIDSVYTQSLGDMTGEAGAIKSMLVLFNSKNALESETIDLSRINKARQRKGRESLLQHRITRLRLSPARMRCADAAGLTYQAARAHLVRGHFKIRSSGVYWWSPFVRGQHGTVGRSRYEVRNGH